MASSRRAFVAAVLFAVFVVWTWAVFLWRSPDTASGQPRQPTTILLARGHRLTQTFRGSVDGLHAVDIRVRSDVDALTSLHFELFREEDGVYMSLGAWVEPVRTTPDTRRHTFAFPPVEVSNGYMFRVAIQPVPGVGTSIGMEGSFDDTLTGGTLALDGSVQPGDLTLETRSLGATAYGRFRLRAIYLPVILRRASIQVLLFAAYSLAWLVAAYVLFVSWEGRASMRWGSLRVVCIAVVALAIGAGAWLGRDVVWPTDTVDLLNLFDMAEKQSNMPVGQALAVERVSINGDSKRVLFMHPDSRAAWRLEVAKNARLKTCLGLNEQAWDKPGDGVVFTAGVADEKGYKELLNQHVNPAVWSADRRWIPVTLDLSGYVGRSVQIVLSTTASPPNWPSDPRYDFAVWGEPQITSYP